MRRGVFLGYIALYRKMRPKNFEQVVGQEHIIKTLRNQIKSERISHAYLFCGTRGTGKTSVAKIFAKAVNCFNPKDGQPCGECELCLSVDGGFNMNVIEIDAASNNSVDNIREIRDEVKYPPTNAKYKVYIIDEVHMLSIGAFNALLKTLEEPPSHVVFILATTDPQKIPVTIHSRCQRFDFKRISAELIGDTLKKYMEAENVSVTDEAVNYIAAVSDGAMRDALSIIDQCQSFYFGEEITLRKVLDVCGAVDSSVFFEMTDALFNQNNEKCMEIIERAVSDGRDIIRFIDDLILHLRNIIVAVSVSEGSYALEFSKENILRYKEQGEKIDRGFIIELINNFSALQSSLKYASNPRVIFEVSCIKICNPVGGENIEQLKAEMRNLRKKIDDGDFIRKESVVPDNEKNEEAPESPKPKPKAASENMKEAVSSWKIFTEDFKMADRSFLLQIKPKILDDKIYLVCSKKGYFDRVLTLKDEITSKLSKKYGRDFDLYVVTEKDFDAKSGEFDMTDVQTEFDFEEDINSKLGDNIVWD